VSSSTRPSTSQPAGPKQQFIAQADAICHKSNEQLARSHVKSKEPAVVAAAIVRNETIERRALGELARLTPPAELAPAWGKMLGYRRSLAGGLGNLAAAVRRGDKKFTALAKSKKQLHAELLEVGGRAGFRDCAKIG
jgi:hypothetical protein